MEVVYLQLVTIIMSGGGLGWKRGVKKSFEKIWFCKNMLAFDSKF